MHDRTQLGFTPNAFIIGAQKSGTTLLAAILATNRDICVTEPKEPHFFSKGFDQGWQAYKACFARPTAKVLLDASTTYSFLRPQRALGTPDAPGLLAPVPKRIFEANPDSRFVYILRDPVARAKSGYLHKMRGKSLPQGPISLLECLREDPMLDLISRYSDQIDRYTEFFPIERFLFVDFRALTQNPLATARTVCDFLSVGDDGMSVDQTERFQHSAHQTTWPRWVFNKINKQVPQIGRIARGIAKNGILRRAASQVGKKPMTVTFRDEDRVADLFASECDRIKALTGISLMQSQSGP